MPLRNPPETVSKAHLQQAVRRELQANPRRYPPGFAFWIRRNWHIFHRLVELVQEAKKRGAKNWSARAAFHVMRWNEGTRMDDPAFKVNNNYSAALARLYNSLSPADEPFFRQRERRAA